MYFTWIQQILPKTDFWCPNSPSNRAIRAPKGVFVRFWGGRLGHAGGLSATTNLTVASDTQPGRSPLGHRFPTKPV